MIPAAPEVASQPGTSAAQNRRIIRLALAGLTLLFSWTAATAESGKWVEVRSPHFIVVSNAGEGRARQIAVQFEQMRVLFRESVLNADTRPSPVVTILAVNGETPLRELLPEYWTENGPRPTGIFLQNFYRFEIAVNSSVRAGVPYEGVYHDYYHALTAPFFPNLPVWVAEGMADFYANSSIADGQVRLGMADAALLGELQHTPWIPLASLVKMERTSPAYDEAKRDSIFYAESWALAHYLMYSDGQSHQVALKAYLEATGRGAAWDEAATSAFGDLGKLQATLESYIKDAAFYLGRNGEFYELRVPAPAPVPDGDLAVRMLSEAETDAYRGGFLALHGQFAAAEPLLDDAVRLDPALALARQNLALLHFWRNQPGEAISAASATIAIEPRNASARFLRAYLEFFVLGNGRAQNPEIETDLRQAIAADPDFAPPYGVLASYLANAHRDLPEALTLAQKGTALEPTDGNFVLATARVMAGMGQFDEAEAEARKARTMLADSQTRQQIDQFIADLSAGKASVLRKAAAQSAEAPAPAGTSPRDVASSSASGTEISDTDAPTVEGLVTDVQCMGTEMLVSLKMQEGGAPLKLHAEDRAKIAYTKNDGAGVDNLSCAELMGQRVRIAFEPVGRAGVEGEIRGLEIVR